MNIRQFSFLTLLFSILFFFSCVDKPIIDDPQLDIPTLSAKVDGVGFSAEGLFITAEYNNSNNAFHTLGIVGAEKVGGTTRAIVLAVVSTDSTGINVGDTYISTSIKKKAAGEYTIDDGGSNDLEAYSSNTDVATITITAIDLDKKLVSGTFSFDGADDDDLNTLYKITEGVFTNVSFE